jgi:DNA recombination protein RmuC
MTTTLAENQGKVTKALTDDLTKLGAGVDAKVTELRTGNEAKLGEIQTKLEVSTAAVATALSTFQVALTEGLGEVRTTLTRIAGEMTTTLAENQGKVTKALTDDLTKLGAGVDAKLTELRAGNEAKLLEIQGVVDQKLQEGIEKRMTESFAKITTQFAEVQQAVGEVKNVAGQVGDLKRLFSNVKSRGGWGEAQVKATLDDILPANSYEMNKCVNPDTSDTVEFALKMPIQGGAPVYLAVDAKFPIEDYTRLLDAVEAADLPAERSARAALEARIRAEARKIQTKYIAPPHTVEWAVLYLPSEGLYAEVTRNGDLMEAIHRDHRVIIMGPSMLGVMLRTIQLGHYTLAIGQKADLIGQILGAVKHEMVDFGEQFRLLEKNVQVIGNNIKRGRRRASVITRRLKGVEALEGPAAVEILELTSEDDDLVGDSGEDEELQSAT